MTEQGSRSDQPIYRHLNVCEEFRENVSLLFTVGDTIQSQLLQIEKHKLDAVLDNYRIIDPNLYNLKWSELEYLEAYYIKINKPKLNHGLKASREFKLFN